MIQSIGRTSCVCATVATALATMMIAALAATPERTALSKILSHQPVTGEKTMTHQSAGTFDVKMTPQPAEATAAGETIGRMLLDKKYHGSLDATGKGQMLAMRTPIDGSAGYVAMELVEGTLDGRNGSFVLQHSGTMNRGAKLLALSVVPDSGSGELIGLSGSMEIILAEGKHSYRFEYSLTSPP